MKCLILASGFGTRLYPLNVDTAKGLIEYKGQALITHIVNKIPFDMDILVNTNKKFEADFYRWKESLSRNLTLCVEPVFNERQALGAVGSLDYWIKARNISDDLLVIASDNYFEFDLLQYIAAFTGKNTLVATHDIGDRSRARHFGVVQVDGCRIVALEEKPLEPKSSLIATGVYIFPQRIFALIHQYCAEGKKDNLGGLIGNLIAKDKVYAYAFNELWLDVGNIETYEEIRKPAEVIAR